MLRPLWNWLKTSTGLQRLLLATDVLIFSLAALMVADRVIPHHYYTTMVMPEDDDYAYAKEFRTITHDGRTFSGRLVLTYPRRMLFGDDESIQLALTVNGLTSDDDFPLILSVTGVGVDAMPRQIKKKLTPGPELENFVISSRSAGHKAVSVKVESPPIDFIVQSNFVVDVYTIEDWFPKVIQVVQILGIPALITGLILLYINRRLAKRDNDPQ